MKWIYLSPHFDDAVFSCGGLIWQQVNKNQPVQIWTICGGEVPAGDLSGYAEGLHQRWKTGREAVALRRLEDERACARLSADHRHFLIPDCIYRRSGDNYWVEAPERNRDREASDGHLYNSDEAIFGSIHPSELGLIQSLGKQLKNAFPPEGELVCPMTVGDHVDHRLTRAAAESLGKPIWYYPDFPYILNDLSQMDEWISNGWESHSFEISKAGLDAWIEAAAAYQSQISTFWINLEALGDALKMYYAQSGGLRLFRKRVK